jgi:hypothetical protein
MRAFRSNHTALPDGGLLEVSDLRLKNMLGRRMEPPSSRWGRTAIRRYALGGAA